MRSPSIPICSGARIVRPMSHVLGIGLAHAYEVAHRRDFPTITLGSRIIVPRDKFMEWIDEQAVKKSEIL